MKDRGDAHPHKDDIHDIQSMRQRKSGLQRVIKARSEPKESPAKIHKKYDNLVSQAHKEINWINIRRNLSSQEYLLCINQMPLCISTL